MAKKTATSSSKKAKPARTPTAPTRRHRYGRRKAADGSPSVDPATRVPQSAPNFGRPFLPQIITFAGRQSTISNTYRNPDEAIRHSLENARFMRNDCSIMESLEGRQRAVALLNWHLEAEDKDDPKQKELVADLTAILEEIEYFTEYRRNLLEAIWYGRTAIANRYEWRVVRGKKRICLKKWTPINGDKLAFRFDDGGGKFDPDQIGIRVGGSFSQGDKIAGDRVIELTENGMCYFLESWERSLMTVHKHMIEDGAFEDPISAGRIHGVGVRDRIYWCWFQKQETMAHLMEVIERTGSGFTIYYYQFGNDESYRKMKEVAEEQTANNVILMPRMAGDESMDAHGIERIEPSTAGIDALKAIIHEFFGHQIKRYILGQILSSESAATGLGSGVADLHQDTFMQIVQYDAVNLEETITRELVEHLKNFNFPWARDIRVKFKIDTKDNESEKKLQAYKSAWDMGCKLKATDVLDIIGASMPDDDDEVLQNPAMQQQQRLWDQAHPQPGDVGPDGSMTGEDGQPAEEGSVEDQFGPLAELLGQGGAQDGGDNQGGADQGGGGPGGNPPPGGPMQGPQQYAKSQVKSSPGQRSMFDPETHRANAAAKWKEELHPREADGKFGEKGAGHKSTATEATAGVRAKQAASSPGQKLLGLAGDAAEQLGMPVPGQEQKPKADDLPFALSGKPVKGKAAFPGSGKTTQVDLFAGRGDAPGQTSFFDDVDPAAKNVGEQGKPEAPAKGPAVDLAHGLKLRPGQRINFDYDVMGSDEKTYTGTVTGFRKLEGYGSDNTWEANIELDEPAMNFGTPIGNVQVFIDPKTKAVSDITTIIPPGSQRKFTAEFKRKLREQNEEPVEKDQRPPMPKEDGDDPHLTRAAEVLKRIPKVSARGLAVQLNGEVSEEHAAELLEKLRGGGRKTEEKPAEQHPGGPPQRRGDYEWKKTKSGTHSAWFKDDKQITGGYAEDSYNGKSAADYAFDVHGLEESPQPSQKSESATAADKALIDDMSKRYGHLSTKEIESKIGDMSAEIASLQHAGRREFNGNGGRRTSAAVSNEGARNVGKEKLRLGIYLQHRKDQESLTPEDRAALPEHLKNVNPAFPSEVEKLKGIAEAGKVKEPQTPEQIVAEARSLNKNIWAHAREKMGSEKLSIEQRRAIMEAAEANPAKEPEKKAPSEARAKAMERSKEVNAEKPAEEKPAGNWWGDSLPEPPKKDPTHEEWLAMDSAEQHRWARHHVDDYSSMSPPQQRQVIANKSGDALAERTKNTPEKSLSQRWSESAKEWDDVAKASGQRADDEHKRKLEVAKGMSDDELKELANDPSWAIREIAQNELDSRKPAAPGSSLKGTHRDDFDVLSSTMTRQIGNETSQKRQERIARGIMEGTPPAVQKELAEHLRQIAPDAHAAIKAAPGIYLHGETFADKAEAEKPKSKTSTEMINEILGKQIAASTAKTTAEKQLEKLEEQRVELNKQGANSRSSIVSKQRRRVDLDERIKNLREKVKAEKAASNPEAVRKLQEAEAAELPANPEAAPNVAPAAVDKFRPDIESDSIFASGQKRTHAGRLGLGTKSISAAALEGANAVWHHQGDPNQTRFNAAQKDAHESATRAAAEMEAALKAGYRFKNHKAGKYGTLWVLEKDGRVLTERGAKSLVAGTGIVNLPEATDRSTADEHIKAAATFIRSLPESTQDNFGALSAAINRSPLGEHVGIDRDSNGMLRLYPKKNKNWSVNEPENGHDAEGNWHRDLDSNLPRFLAKLDHMAANKISDSDHWTTHDRNADEHARQQVPIGGKTPTHSPAVHSAIEEAHQALHAAGLAEKPAEPEASPTSPLTLADLGKHQEAIRTGKANAAQIRDWFEHYHGDQSAARKELESKSVAELKAMGAGGWDANRMKKADLVKSMIDQIGEQYHVGRSGYHWNPTGESKLDALRRAIGSQTDEHVNKHVEQIAAARAERKERISGVVKAIENPETLEDFRTRDKYKSESAPPLTDEQQAKYDDLAAKDRREKEIAKKSTVSAFRPGSAATGQVGIVEGHHQKRNAPTYTVTLENHLGDNWDDALSRAKRMGGNYVNARIAKQYGATAGFQFFDKKSAEDFAKVLGGESADTSEQVEQRRIESIDNASERLAALAENTHATADEALNADRKTNTSKRAEQAASAEATARSQKALAETMERLSGAMKEGKAPHLEGIRHGSHVSELNSQLRRARWARMQAEGVHKRPHDEYQAFNDMPPEESDIQHTDYPYPAIWSDQLQKHLADIKDEPGLMKIAQRLGKTAEDAPSFKGTVGKMKAGGGRILDPSKVESVRFANMPEGRGIRVHQSYDYKLAQAGKGNGPFYTADQGKTWATTPEIAVNGAVSRGNDLDLVDLPKPKLLKITDPSDIADLATAAKRLRRHSNRDLRRIGDDLTGRIESYNRMRAMDIKSPGELRAALRDYLPLRTKPKGEDKIKKLERELVGRKIEGFFPTPQPLVERMLDAADIQPGHNVLEPSAGKGDILDAIRERHPDAATAAIEPHSDLRSIIEAKGHALVDRDFTQHGESYDRIVMNPPFERGQDAEHVQHAFDRLKPGGRVVAIMSNGPFFRSDKKSEAFRQWLESVDGSHEELPEGSFAGQDAFRQTGVNTRLVVIDKPKE